MAIPLPIFWAYCKWSSTTAGTGAFTVGAAAPSDGAGPHDVPANCNVTNGNTYKYFAYTTDGVNLLQTEAGFGAYNKATGTLARTTIETNTDRTTTPCDFTSDPVVVMFPNPSQTVEMPGEAYDHFPSGTLMLFQQTNAPTGWTKQTTHNDKVLRVVTGTTGSGGTNSFSATFVYRTSDGSSLSIAQSAAHTHGPGTGTHFLTDPIVGLQFSTGSDINYAENATTTASTGSSAAHSHTYDMRVQYVDLIIAQKN